MPCAEPPHLFHPTRGGARGLVKSVPRFEPQASCSPQPAPPLGAKRNWQQASDPGVLRRFRALAGKRNHPLFRPATALLGSEPARGTPGSASAGQGRAGPGALSPPPPGACAATSVAPAPKLQAVQMQEQQRTRVPAPAYRETQAPGPGPRGRLRGLGQSRAHCCRPRAKERGPPGR